ncbi:MAG: uroporphyrinogen-III C-methyltransferase [Pseudanabaenaceae cyanobacterium]
MGKVYLVGAGPGDPLLLTIKGRAILGQADVVLYDALVSPGVLAFAHPQALQVAVGKQRGQHSICQSEINDLLIKYAQQAETVVRLKNGDPMIFGRAGEEIEALRRAGIPVEVVPGITAGLSTGIPLTHRLYSSSVIFVTGHEAIAKTGKPVNWQGLAHSADTIVIYMGLHNLAEITQKLIASGLSPHTPIALVREATKPESARIVSTLGKICEELAQQEFLPPAIAIVGEVVKFFLL